MSKRYKTREREQLVEAVRTSGEPVKVIARRMGVKESTAYFWMKRARAARSPEFARVIPTAMQARASMSIEVGGVVIRLDDGFDATLLREVVSALGGR
jgi:transposase-like protein